MLNNEYSITNSDLLTKCLWLMIENEQIFGKIN